MDSENEDEMGAQGDESTQNMFSIVNLEKRGESSLNFDGWTEAEKVENIKNLLLNMNHCSLSKIDDILQTLLKRDFITMLPIFGLEHIAETILSYLEAESLCAAAQVSKDWNAFIADAMLWKKLIERKVRSDPVWQGIADRRGWMNHLFKPIRGTSHPDHSFYQRLYPRVVTDRQNLESNWMNGDPNILQIGSRSAGDSKGVYCFQEDRYKIVSGSRDNTIRIWDRESLKCVKVLTGHSGSVLCLRFDEKFIISGSSDATVCVWDLKNGELVNTLIHHSEAVLNLKFKNGLMITSSKDRTIAVWKIVSSLEINLQRILLGHKAAVNAVDFDEKYIVSASGDRTMKVWNTQTCEFVRTMRGHERGIACVQYRDSMVVSGSSDTTIRLWNIENGECLKVFLGHEDLVRCIRFDHKWIVSGSYNGEIKLWDLQAALNGSTLTSTCLRTVVKHADRVFALQFDDFQIISSSHDDTIIIYDFLNCGNQDIDYSPK